MTTLPLLPDELLTTTRSVRKRLDLDRPVPLELVTDCLKIALQAPTGGNSQGWHWIVITDPELRKGVAGYYRRGYDAYRAVVDRATPLGDGARRATLGRVRSSSEFLAAHMADVPVLVLGGIEAAARLTDENQAPLWGSLLPAAWSYQLAARARGLGTAWTTLHLAHEREVAELLGIPPHVRQGVLLPTAYYTGETFRPASREPLETVLHLDRW